MRKLSKLMESVWGDMRRRSDGQDIRKEDGKIVQKITIDGVEYKFTDKFWGMGDAYVEENEQDWNCFGFKKNPNGSTLITGDTDEVGKFSHYDDDINDREDYDVYYLKDYDDQEKYINTLLEKGYVLNFNGPEEVKQLLIDYTKRIFSENHMSEYAEHRIFDITSSDINEDFAIYPVSEIDNQDIPEQYQLNKDDIIAINSMTFPELGDADNPWSETLERDLIELYTNLGWVQLEEYELDPWGGWPSGETALMFVKVKDGVEVYVHDDEDDEEDEF